MLSKKNQLKYYIINTLFWISVVQHGTEITFNYFNIFEVGVGWYCMISNSRNAEVVLQRKTKKGSSGMFHWNGTICVDRQPAVDTTTVDVAKKKLRFVHPVWPNTEGKNMFIFELPGLSRIPISRNSKVATNQFFFSNWFAAHVRCKDCSSWLCAEISTGCSQCFRFSDKFQGNFWYIPTRSICDPSSEYRAPWSSNRITSFSFGWNCSIAWLVEWWTSPY